MYSWNCCRICLSLQTLNPIFLLPEHSEKYSNTIFIATGIKVQIDDKLPQEMCSTCINFINESIKIRKKAEEAQRTLVDRLKNNRLYDIKVESPYICKTENDTNVTELFIDISNEVDNDFKDHDDNLTLDTFQYCNDKGNDVSTQLKYETEVRSTDEPVDREYRLRQNCAKDKTAKRSTTKRKKTIEKTEGERKKDSNKIKTKKIERVKEEIECEYCHKILTSRLSLRNHYKIHTGFDVVCEHCGKRFITRRLLLMHCRAKHGYEKTDKCSYCDYRASNAEQVKIHERLHTGEKPYVCKECSAGFHRKSSYLQHIAIHLPDKNVQCDQCPARFKSVTLMRIHKNRHRAPQYTFRCRVCDNSFARRRNVARHLQRVHGLPPDAHHVDRLKIN
ncbi:zinc finger and SCAN domain-containing protein 12-like [Galleria mellonella]|uniref:Zinc finger and SCAN domain-containing protein 12-like n=1 Tax=Galleria mellonella TaxID=7137 RepID=A0A6J1WXD2_GALME|nr:zinc finger and SCAN domain-containing protein 12-like [Galleria mellonella]